MKFNRIKSFNDRKFLVMENTVIGFCVLSHEGVSSVCSMSLGT